MEFVWDIRKERSNRRKHGTGFREAATVFALSQWKEFAGVKLPQEITSFHNGKKVAAITVERTKLNQGLKLTDLSVKPPDLKPVMP